MTSSETSSSHWKCKHDVTGEMLPPSSKWGSKSKMDMLNPVIISSQLNFTLTHPADVMEKSLDVTTISIEPLTTPPVPPSSPQALSILSQLPGPQSTLSLTLSSDSEVLDKAIRIVTADKDFLLEVDLLAASLFFSNTSNELVHVAQTFIALSDRLCNIAFFCVNLKMWVLITQERGREKLLWMLMTMIQCHTSPPFLCFHLVMSGPCVVLSLCLVSSYMMLFDTS